LSPERLEQRARNILLFQLSSGAKTSKQLADRLSKKEIPNELAQRLIERFKEVGLIDDHQVAETIARSRRESRGWSSAAIRRDLLKRGVPSQIIDDVLAEFDSTSELSTAVKIARQRYARLANLPPDVASRRLAGFLARRGYSNSVVFEAVRQSLATVRGE
jgi:regulatory protein